MVSSIDVLHNIVTKDVATDQIQDILLNAEKHGQEQLNFVGGGVDKT